MCGYDYTEKLPHIGKGSPVGGPLYTALFILELYFVFVVVYFSGWRGNQTEALCSVQVEQKKRRLDDTVSTKKKPWRSCMTRFKRNLKRKKEVKKSI